MPDVLQITLSACSMPKPVSSLGVFHAEGKMCFLSIQGKALDCSWIIPALMLFSLPSPLDLFFSPCLLPYLLTPSILS